jgi:RNA polymerase sigma factor (sigma-70 family)
MPERPQAPFSTEVLVAYTRDVARYPRQSVADQRADLVELASRRADLWAYLLAFKPLQRQVVAAVSTIEKAPSVPRTLRSPASRYRLDELHDFIKILSVTPYNAELLEQVMVEIDALSQKKPSSLSLPECRRAQFAAFLPTAKHLQIQVRRQRDYLVSTNLRLVFGVAKRFRSVVVPYEDMLSEGNFGLIRAVDRFDVRHDVRFSTYAVHWIRHLISRFIDDFSRTVRVPVNARTAFKAVRKAKEQLEREFGEPPSLEQVAKKAGLRADRVAQLERDMMLPLSLDAEFGEWGTALADIVEDDAPQPDEVVVQRRRHYALHGELATFNGLHAKVIRERYGLDDDEPRTLEAIGQDLDLSRERVRQIQVIALDRLRVRARAAMGG